jgi:hypothetical protein
MKDYFDLQLEMSHRKIKKAGINPVLGSVALI